MRTATKPAGRHRNLFATYVRFHNLVPIISTWATAMQFTAILLETLEYGAHSETR